MNYYNHRQGPQIRISYCNRPKKKILGSTMLAHFWDMVTTLAILWVIVQFIVALRDFFFN